VPSLGPAAWKLWGVRPANAPARRLAAAAQLFAGLPPAALLLLAGAPTAREAMAPFAALRAGGYWRDHHDPCAGPSALPEAQVGRGRALEILVNVVLPAAAAHGDAALGASARRLYAALPRPGAYGATRHLERTLAAQGERIPLNARRTQALLALARDWCAQGGCGRCPLS
jgi:hypothetical protein